MISQSRIKINKAVTTYAIARRHSNIKTTIQYYVYKETKSVTYYYYTVIMREG